MVRPLPLILAGLLLLLPRGAAEAAKLVVAAHGVDGGACGTKLAPCRSIGAALARAVPGDTVEVGPGRYGDLDGDGLLDPGDEAAQVGSGCNCLVHVAAAVRVVSRDGSGATLIDAAGLPVDVVRVDATGASFGAPRKGFTLTGSSSGEGLRVDGDGVRVEANLSVGNGDNGFQINGDVFRFSGNRMVGNGGTGVDFEASDGVLRGNTAIRNKDGGFEIETRNRAEGNLAALNAADRPAIELQGQDNLVRRNAALGGDAGFDLGTRNRLEENAANANQRGILVDRADNLVVGNQVVGNLGPGLLVGLEGGGEIRGNSIYGNAVFDLGEGLNCGVALQNPALPPLVGNFWGAASGPGADPGDDVCILVPIVELPLVDPFATAEIRPKVKAAQLLAKLAKALAPPPPPAAPRLFVSKLGSDAPLCGAQASPCLTIAAALAAAAPGDTIEVGPGRYGDANGDGDFDDPGDEPAEIGSGCECAIHLDVPVTLRSRDGAGATLLSGGLAVTDVVRVAAAGAALGAPKRGFTVTGAAGISADGIDASADDVRVEGNLLSANQGSGLRLLGEGAAVVGNQAIENGSAGFDLADATQAVVAANLSIANGDAGFELGEGVRASGNQAAANGASGFIVTGSGGTLLANALIGNTVAGAQLSGTDNRLEGNVLAGNGRGVEILAAGAVVRGNSIVGSAGVGVLVDVAESATVTGNTIAGNHAGVDATLPPADNCGLAFTGAAAPVFPSNFWGAPGGPGPDPADDLCPLGSMLTPVVDPVAASEIRVKVKAAR